jgi:hypothetical protein
MPENPPVITTKLLKLPTDWVARIDCLRGEVSFNEFVRQALLEKIGRDGLSSMPAWGQGRPKARR